MQLRISRSPRGVSIAQGLPSSLKMVCLLKKSPDLLLIYLLLSSFQADGQEFEPLVAQSQGLFAGRHFVVIVFYVPPIWQFILRSESVKFLALSKVPRAPPPHLLPLPSLAVFSWIGCRKATRTHTVLPLVA